MFPVPLGDISMFYFRRLLFCNRVSFRGRSLDFSLVLLPLNIHYSCHCPPCQYQLYLSLSSLSISSIPEGGGVVPGTWYLVSGTFSLCFPRLFFPWKKTSLLPSRRSAAAVKGRPLLFIPSSQALFSFL